MKYTNNHYEDADQAARDDLENRVPMTPEEQEARLTLLEIANETRSSFEELFEED